MNLNDTQRDILNKCNEKDVSKKKRQNVHNLHMQYMYLFLMLSVVLAATIPHLDLMIALVGSVGCAALTLLIPPLLEILTLWPDGLLGPYHWKLIKDMLILLFGFVGFVVGTGVSVYQIILSFSQGYK